MAKSKAPVVVDFETQEYWDKAQEIVQKAGVYASAEKLRRNLEDEATRWKVVEVLERYYENDEGFLADSIRFKRREIRQAIRDFNVLASQNGRHEITKPDALIALLMNEERRRKYKAFIEKHRKKNKMVDLQQIEMEFREWRNRPRKAPKKKK